MVKTPNQHLTIPPLENGDRLNRYEFERRYDAMPNLRKAELIEGIVYMPAALRFKSHSQPHSRMSGCVAKTGFHPDFPRHFPKRRVRECLRSNT